MNLPFSKILENIKLQHTPTIGPATPLSRENESYIYDTKTCTQCSKQFCDSPQMETTQMSIKRWNCGKQPKCPSIGEWIKKMWNIHTIEYYSAMRKDILLFAVIWMDLEGIMLSEISQRKTNTEWYHLHAQSRKTKLIETETRMMVTKDWEVREKGEIVSQRVQIFSHKMSKFWGSNVQQRGYS